MTQDPFLTKQSLAGVVERVSLTPPPLHLEFARGNADFGLGLSQEGPILKFKTAETAFSEIAASDVWLVWDAQDLPPGFTANVVVDCHYIIAIGMFSMSSDILNNSHGISEASPMIRVNGVICHISNPYILGSEGITLTLDFTPYVDSIPNGSGQQKIMASFLRANIFHSSETNSFGYYAKPTNMMKL